MMLTISETMTDGMKKAITHEISGATTDGRTITGTDESRTNNPGAKKGRVRKVFRGIALSLHVIAMLSYFIPTLVMGSSMDTRWLVIGVIYTGLFCLMFYRNSRRRRVLSVIILILKILWCGLWVIMILPTMPWSVSYDMLFIYILSSLLAAIFALAFPRKV